MNLTVGSTFWLDDDPHREVIIVGAADSADGLHDLRFDSDDIFTPFMPARSEWVAVRNVDTGVEDRVERHRLKPAAAAHGEGGKRVELRAGAQ